MVGYKIKGGRPIQGQLKISGNKNSALPCLAATLLTDEPVTLRNVPALHDVQVMVDLLRDLGSEISAPEPGVLVVQTRDLDSHGTIDDKARRLRASLLLVGPLLARVGSVQLPPPGGDVIGRRRLDTHFLALESLGAKGHINAGLHLSTTKLVGAEIFLDEASVTATENAIMAAALAHGRTTIFNAACEPHVQDLCHLLLQMGVKIEGIGSNLLHIEGQKKLGGTDFRIGTDYMEAGSFIGMGAATGGELELLDCDPAHLRMCRLAFRRLGIEWEEDERNIYLPAKQKKRVIYELDGSIPRIDDAPWPGFPPDLTSIIAVVATQVTGTVLLHEKMFESRLYFTDYLSGMGARIILCDPHRAVISGPTRLLGDRLPSPDVRAGMALLIAAMCAEGVSTIHNVYQIERGYERLVERLATVGVEISRFSS